MAKARKKARKPVKRSAKKSQSVAKSSGKRGAGEKVRAAKRAKARKEVHRGNPWWTPSLRLVQLRSRLDGHNTFED